MPAKKKKEDTSETIVKTPRKRTTKKAIESEIVASNDSTVTSEVNEANEASEVVEIVEVVEVVEAANDKSAEVNEVNEVNEVVGTLASDNVETTQLTSLDNVEITDNKETNANDVNNTQEENSNKKEKKEGIYVQRKFYERVMGEKLEVTVQLEKLKITGIITYEHPFYILVETKQGEQFIYKQSISYISAKKPFIKRPFIKRDRPFFNNRENTENQPINDNAQVGEDSSNNQPTFDKPQTQKPYIKRSQPSEQPNEQTSEQPMKRPNEPRPLNRYQNQKPKNQSKDQPQKDAREVKVYKIVCAPPVNKPKK